MKCLLCSSESAAFYIKEEKDRGELTYFQCSGPCGLIFLNPKQRLGESEEKERYDLHNNDPDDQGYIDFLHRVTDELVPLLSPGAEGLDFGCGPGPAMQTILEPLGFMVSNYDPYYFADAAVLERQYDFITSTEVFEHLYDPLATLRQVDSLLKAGGVLAVMTEMVNEPASQKEFAKWWYHTDPTHVCFYSQQTFEWIAEQFGYAVEFPRKNVVLLKKQ